MIADIDTVTPNGKLSFCYRMGIFLLKASIMITGITLIQCILVNISRPIAHYCLIPGIGTWTLIFPLLTIANIFVLYPLGQVLVIISPERGRDNVAVVSVFSALCLMINFISIHYHPLMLM